MLQTIAYLIAILGALAGGWIALTAWTLEAPYSLEQYGGYIAALTVAAIPYMIARAVDGISQASRRDNRE